MKKFIKCVKSDENWFTVGKLYPVNPCDLDGHVWIIDNQNYKWHVEEGRVAEAFTQRFVQGGLDIRFEDVSESVTDKTVAKTMIGDLKKERMRIDKEIKELEEIVSRVGCRQKQTSVGLQAQNTLLSLIPSITWSALEAALSAWCSIRTGKQRVGKPSSNTRPTC